MSTIRTDSASSQPRRQLERGWHFLGKRQVHRGREAVGLTNTVSTDVIHDPQEGLSKRSVQREVVARLLSSECRGALIGCHCAIRSRARRGGGPPLRTNSHGFGVPILSDSDREKVSVGNSLAAFSLRVFNLCRELGEICRMEKHQTSLLWELPGFQKTVALLRVATRDAHVTNLSANAQGEGIAVGLDAFTGSAREKQLMAASGFLLLNHTLALCDRASIKCLRRAKQRKIAPPGGFLL
eukprot:8047340-Pyramimonas_sp.AAC.1